MIKILMGKEGKKATRSRSASSPLGEADRAGGIPFHLRGLSAVDIVFYMPTMPTRQRGRSTVPAIRVVSALVVGFALLAVSIVFVVGGLAVIIFGVRDVFAGSDSAVRLVGILLVILGLAAIMVGGLTLERLMPHAVSRLSGRRLNPHSGGSSRFYGGGFGADGGGGVGGGDGGGGAGGC